MTLTMNVQYITETRTEAIGEVAAEGPEDAAGERIGGGEHGPRT